MTHEQKDYWFRPKLFGYGAEPLNWKGWLATLAYLAVLLAIVLPAIIWPALKGQQADARNVALAIILMIAVTAPFLWFCWIKTDGEWRWRWGKRD